MLEPYQHHQMVIRAVEKTVVISHWDIDGLASATMLTEYYKPLKTILSSVTATPKNILKAIDLIGYNGLIVVSDLNPQTNHARILREIFELAKEKKIEIVWIDHHEWDKTIYRLFIENSEVVWYLDDTSTVTADLVARRYGFLDKGEFYQKLVDLAIDDDYFINRYELTVMWRRILRWYGWGTRYKALSSLLKHELDPVWMRRLYYVEVKNIYENLIREAIARSDYIVTRNGIRIIVFQDVDPRIHPGEITLIAKKNKLLADIYIVRYPRGTSLRSDAVDVSMIARLLGGGGHRNAAGIPGKIDLSSILALISNIKIKAGESSDIVYA